MTKNCLFAVALVSVALWSGCAKGLGSTPSVTVTDNGISVVPVKQSVPITAKVTGTNNTAVNWSLSGGACSGAGNPCGTITPSAPGSTSATYQAPDAAPSPATVNIVATSQADSSGTGQLQIRVAQITIDMGPATVNVGQKLVQQFTAVAVPDIAPQTFTWAVSCQGGAGCGTLVQDANVSGLAVYTAPSSLPGTCTTINNCVQVTATSTVDPTKPGKAKILVESERIPAGMYTIRSSGYDSANHAVATAGSLTFGAGGSITSGVEDVVINGVYHQYTSVSGSYVPSTAGDNNTNNAGKLTVSASGGPTYVYTAVLDSVGNLRIIEADGNGTGSGAMEKTATSSIAAGRFAFGLTGVDSNGKRAGYVGVLPLDGTGNVSNGQLDPNDNGTTSNTCGTPPCTVAGSYQSSASIPGLWQMTLTTGTTLHFDFFIGSGTTNDATNPLTLYTISTDALDAIHPAVSGRMVLQDSGTTYDKTALGSDSISHLTGVDSTGSNTVVSLVAATGDGNGNISLTFDQNNAGTIVAASTQFSTCTYTADTNKTGRYVVTLLGTGSGTCTGGVPFVLYASGKNRGFLLDQSSAAVMTGAMDPQLGVGNFSGSSLPGTYAAATVNSATSGVTPMAANLVLTYPASQVFNVGGTQYPGPVAVTGTYTMTFVGTGTIVLTAPAAKYVIYATDLTHFEMIDVDASVTNASVIFAQE